MTVIKPQEAAELIIGSPESNAPQNRAQLEPLMATVDLLLEAGLVAPAHEIVRQRLEEARIFELLGLQPMGLQCMHSFLVSPAAKERWQDPQHTHEHWFYTHNAAIFCRTNR